MTETDPSECKPFGRPPRSQKRSDRADGRFFKSPANGLRMQFRFCMKPFLPNTCPFATQPGVGTKTIEPKGCFSDSLHLPLWGRDRFQIKPFLPNACGLVIQPGVGRRAIGPKCDFSGHRQIHAGADPDFEKDNSFRVCTLWHPTPGLEKRIAEPNGNL